jgi:hypothetical protein
MSNRVYTYCAAEAADWIEAEMVRFLERCALLGHTLTDEEWNAKCAELMEAGWVRAGGSDDAVVETGSRT